MSVSVFLSFTSAIVLWLNSVGRGDKPISPKRYMLYLVRPADKRGNPVIPVLARLEVVAKPVERDAAPPIFIDVNAEFGPLAVGILIKVTPAVEQGDAGMHIVLLWGLALVVVEEDPGVAGGAISRVQTNPAEGGAGLEFIYLEDGGRRKFGGTISYCDVRGFVLDGWSSRDDSGKSQHLGEEVKLHFSKEGRGLS